MSVVTLELSGGVKITASVHSALDASKLGKLHSHLENKVLYLPTLVKEHAGPLLQFLETGSYIPPYVGKQTEDVLESEAACYKASCTDDLFVPGFLRDVERVLYNRMTTGHARIDDTCVRFAGYERVLCICGVVWNDCIGIPHRNLVSHLIEDRSLFIFHRDPSQLVETIYMTLVLDIASTYKDNIIYKCMKDTYSDRGWFTGGNNPSNNRFMSFTTKDAVDVESLTTASKDKYMCSKQYMIDVLANAPWRQVGDDGTRVPVFPSIDTVNLVVSAEKRDNLLTCVFARDEKWRQFLVPK